VPILPKAAPIPHKTDPFPRREPTIPPNMPQTTSKTT
jgi:hypothetical protein